MATAMELAFARSRGVYLEPTAPDGNPEDISHTIIVIIEKTRFTLRQLMDGVALPLSDIDPEILANALPFLDPGRRNYIEKDGKRFFQKPPR